ncbi:MAG: hypothetical protein ACXVRJ_09310 [Gaiellaceae bacterium]
MTERALYLEGGAEGIFAVHHAPETPGPSSSAVLLVPPFGWEEIASHRARREWALELVGAGHHVLRFDLPGTGDSAGELDEPGRWESWLAATLRAAEWLRVESGAARTAAIGIASGGYLAFEAAAAGLVDDVVLWATPAKGRQYLRELAAFGALEASMIAAGGGPPAEAATDAIEAGGFVLPQEIASVLRAADLEQRALPETSRLLLLDRDGVGSTGRLEAALATAGVRVEAAHGTGYAEMMAPPDKATSPRAVFAVVGAWLVRDGAPPAATAPAAAPATADVLELDGVRERPLTIDRPRGRLRGVLAEPADEASSPIALVFLNAGAIRRIGPHRLWVKTARRWARQGVPSLRIDLEGIGDADGDGDAYHDVARFHDPHLVEHVTATLDALVEQGLPTRFVLIGLCSGGFWAFQSALTDERAAGAVMVNTRILFWHDHLDAFRDLHRTRLLTHATTWKRVLRGEVSAERWKSFARTMGASIGARLLSRGHAREPSVFEWQALQVANAFTLLQEAGHSAHFVFCDGEPLRDELTAAQLLDRPERWPSVTATILPGRDHTFNPTWMHPHADAALDEAIRSELALVAGGRGPAVGAT